MTTTLSELKLSELCEAEQGDLQLETPALTGISSMASHKMALQELKEESYEMTEQQKNLQEKYENTKEFAHAKHFEIIQLLSQLFGKYMENIEMSYLKKQEILKQRKKQIEKSYKFHQKKMKIVSSKSRHTTPAAARKIPLKRAQTTIESNLLFDNSIIEENNENEDSIIMSHFGNNNNNNFSNYLHNEQRENQLLNQQIQSIENFKFPKMKKLNQIINELKSMNNDIKLDNALIKLKNNENRKLQAKMERQKQEITNNKEICQNGYVGDRSMTIESKPVNTSNNDKNENNNSHKTSNHARAHSLINNVGAGTIIPQTNNNRRCTFGMNNNTKSTTSAIDLNALKDVISNEDDEDDDDDDDDDDGNEEQLDQIGNMNNMNMNHNNHNNHNDHNRNVNDKTRPSYTVDYTYSYSDIEESSSKRQKGKGFAASNGDNDDMYDDSELTKMTGVRVTAAPREQIINYKQKYGHRRVSDFTDYLLDIARSARIAASPQVTVEERINIPNLDIFEQMLDSLSNDNDDNDVRNNGKTNTNSHHRTQTVPQKLCSHKNKRNSNVIDYQLKTANTNNNINQEINNNAQNVNGSVRNNGDRSNDYSGRHKHNLTVDSGRVSEASVIDINDENGYRDDVDERLSNMTNAANSENELQFDSCTDHETNTVISSVTSNHTISTLSTANAIGKTGNNSMTSIHYNYTNMYANAHVNNGKPLPNIPNKNGQNINKAVPEPNGKLGKVSSMKSMWEARARSISKQSDTKVENTMRPQSAHYHGSTNDFHHRTSFC